MNSAIERLLGLRVSDIMNKEIVMISENASMGEAAKTLFDNEVSGMPVVNESGRCVGILSATDFVIRERGRVETSKLGTDEHRLAQMPDGGFCIEEVNEDRVGEHMTPVVQTVRAESTLINAARVMCYEHLHRLVIVDECEQPVGVVSSLDLVAAMVAAIEE